jgi:predicted ATPase/DNA-binding SARP family transcriptional activator
MSNKITYRQQYTRCGKERCRKCREGQGHGPYWYAYRSEKGRTVSKYVGIHLPTGAEVEQSAEPQLPLQEQTPAKRNTSHITPLPDSSDTAKQEAAPELRVYLLGQFRVERRTEHGWHVIDHHTWQRRRARSLLGCLLTSPGRRVGREQAMDLLWPDLEADISTNRLNGAVHELRQLLEPALRRPAASRMLRLEHDILELADNSLIWVDVDALEAMLKEAEQLAPAHPLQAEHLLEEATTRYGGVYLLEELYAEWAAPRRDALQRRWIGTLLDLAQMRVERGDFAAAIETLDRLRVADSANETALQRLMVLLTQTDRRGEALHLYRQHAATLQREYEALPLLETRQLYEELSNGAPASDYIAKWRQNHNRGYDRSIPQSTPVSTTQPTLPTPTLRPAFFTGRQRQSPLTGRDQEMQIMRNALHALEHSYKPTQAEKSPASYPFPRHNYCHLLLLLGESGLGKTRLAEELSHEASTRNWTVVWSRVHEQGGNAPYHPWRSILRSLLPTIQEQVSRRERDAYITSTLTPELPAYQLGWLGPLVPELASTSAYPHLSLSYEQERLRLWEATLGFLSTVSEQHPLLLVLDDLHWADESSVELLTYLSHHLRNQRILLVGTCRDDELAPSHKIRSLVSALQREQTVVTLSVQPLTNREIGTLVAHLPQDLVTHIQTQAAGNPLFAEEMARSAISAGSETVESKTVTVREEPFPYMHTPPSPQRSEDVHVGHDYLSPVPAVVTSLLERRLRRLSTDCQALMSKGAILGGSFELRQLLLMASDYTEDTTLDLLDEALQEGLLLEEGMGSHITYRFWHPLIISHLYERLSAARRAQLHRKAAEVLKGVSSPLSHEKMASTIVYHMVRGGSEPQDIMTYAELAGNQAGALSAYPQAYYYYMQAVQALTGLPTSGKVSVSLENLLQTSSTKNASTSRDSSFSLGSCDLVQLCRLLEQAAECDRVLGDFEDARRLYECILAIRASATFQRQLATTSLIRELSKQEQQQRESQVQALLWRELSATWVATGDYDKAYECCERGRNAMQRANVTSGAVWACVCLQIGSILRYKGSYQEARLYAQEALSLLNDVYKHGEYALTQQVASSTHTSRPQTRTERALDGDLTYLGHAHELLGVITASEGQLREALTELHISLHSYEQQALVSEVIIACGNLGAVYIMKGDLASASTFLHRALELAEQVGDLPNLAFITGNLGDIAHRAGNLSEAEQWFTRSLALAERVHDREHISWCCVALAAVQQDMGRLREASQHLLRAIRTGRAIKNSRCIRFALVSLGDLRIIEAIIACTLPPTQGSHERQQRALSQRLLQRAKSTLQRAISQEEVEKETIIECKLLLAHVYYLLDQLDTARQMTQHILQEATGQETSRAVGRTQRLLGRILAAQQYDKEAYASFEQALTLFQTQGLRLDEARTLHGYGLALVQQSARMNGESNQQKLYRRGIEYLQQAHTLFIATHAAVDLAWIEQELDKYTTISTC